MGTIILRRETAVESRALACVRASASGRVHVVFVTILYYYVYVIVYTYTHTHMCIIILCGPRCVCIYICMYYYDDVRGAAVCACKYIRPVSRMGTHR